MADVRSGIGALRPYATEAGPEDKLTLAMQDLTICEDWIGKEMERQCGGLDPNGLTLGGRSALGQKAVIQPDQPNVRFARWSQRVEATLYLRRKRWSG